MIFNNIFSLHRIHSINEKERYGAYKIFFRTLVSDSRLKIINLLRKGRMNVSEIIAKLSMNQTAVSHDLSRLKRCGFVNTERKGKYIYYSLNEETIKPLMAIIDKHMAEHCVRILKNKRGE